MSDYGDEYRDDDYGGYGDDDYGGYRDDDYGGYGDYGDEGGENDYGDEGGDEGGDEYGEYKYPEEEDYKFSYRDIGAEGRVGAFVDDELDLPFGTEDTVQYRIQLDPDILFKLDLQKILRSEQNLFLTPTEKSKIKKSVSKLPMIRYKNPLTYVLGFYIYSDMREDNKITPGLKAKFRTLDNYVKANESITLFEVMKYARYWKFILSK